jgi:SAM-dependent MidA family methyltransferase
MPPTVKDVSSIQTTALAAYLSDKIKREGPMTFCDWMEVALYHPTHGYYCRSDRKRWGREGDYRTSPERSELFAAAFARYFASLYDELHRPPEWTIVEMGAGDGSFARGLLQSLRDFFPQVFQATRYLIDERSASSRELAREQVAAFADRVRFEPLGMVERIDPGIIFSNELLDAFPVHRVTKKHGRLFEFYVNVTPDENFVWNLGDLSTNRLTDYCQQLETELSEDQIVEISLATEEWFAQVAEKLATGYLITVDYGAGTSSLHDASERFQGTLRAYSRHQFADNLLARPGDQDITTTIDWAYVTRVGAKLGFEVVEFSSQDRFLLRAGLLEELARQSKAAPSDADKLRLSTTAREMILPGGMSSSFQVLVQKRIST